MRRSLLESLDLPGDLKQLSTRQMRKLAQEVRELIVEVVSSNGGHLAPSLGVVELTLAMLAVMDAPNDKIVWDVGHQCYAYKILTDRRDKFHTLRQLNGISGFPKPEESHFDCFATGHASTSISAALGIAQARDLAGGNYTVTAVIGDGSLGGGMAWEAINNAGASKTDLLVILNDNKMSISPSIGAMASHMAMLRSMPLYRTVESSAKSIFRRMPVGGGLMSRTSDALKHGLTHMVSPTSGTVFEAMGFEYFGPINGHDIAQLRHFISQAREMSGPVLLHVVTTKGKGYHIAEHDARHFHGVGPFNSSNGKLNSKSSCTYTSAFGDALLKIAHDDPRVVAITAAMPDGTGLARFSERYPKRFFNVGIAEEHAVTFAAGLALAGMKPVVAIYSTFMQRAYDQIVHDVCMQNLPVVMMLDRAGIVGEDGPTHHGVFDLSYLRHIPNLVLMAPKDSTELADMLNTAVKLDSPVAIRYPRGEAPQVERISLREIPLGSAEVLREGNDVAIIAVGAIVNAAVKAAEQLAASGVQARVLNARYIKPIDETAILSAARDCGAVVLAEENVIQGGFASGVLECLAKNDMLDTGIEVVALPDNFIPHGKSSEIRTKYGLNAQGIYEAAVRVLSKTKLINVKQGEDIAIRQNI